MHPHAGLCSKLSHNLAPVADRGTHLWHRARAHSPTRGRATEVVAALLLLGLFTLSACAPGGPVEQHEAAASPAIAAPSAPPTSPTSPTSLAIADPGGARLRVTQDLTSCCYPSGHLSWFLVVAPDGGDLVRRQVRPPADPFPLMDQILPAGQYHLVSAQQECARTCASTRDAVDRCDADVDLAAGSTTYLTVGVDPGSGCAIVLARGPMASPIADDVVLPHATIDCGYDASLAAVAATGHNVVLSEARRCLAVAAARGDSAWLMADEPRDRAGIEVVVYRLAADGTVAVYRVAEPTAAVWAWVRSVCAAVVPDDVRAFLVQGCSAPEAVPWVAAA